jgi:acetyl-CoA C-acetyltransferase
VLPEVVRRSGVDPADIDDIIFAESHYGGGDLARYADDAIGLLHVPGQSEEMDAWAARSHQRAIAAMDEGKFLQEIVPLKVQQFDGSVVDVSVDEHPRRDTTVEKLAGLKVLHPEIEGFSITAGNSSGTNDAAAGVALVERQYAEAQRLSVMATVKAWAAAGVAPPRHRAGRRQGYRQGPRPGGSQAVRRHAVGDQRGLRIGADRRMPRVRSGRGEGNFSGSGCSLGHPIAASGARMVTTLVYELRRRGGGIDVAAMCADGGQGGAVVVEV